jgi:hypothetical protein
LFYYLFTEYYKEKPTYLNYEISWILLYFFTNLESEIAFYNNGLDTGCFMVVGIPTRFPKHFLNSKFFIATKKISTNNY